MAAAIALAASAALSALSAPLAALVPALVAAGVLAMSWNGLSFTAAAEMSGRDRAGTAIGIQNTLLSLAGVVAPVGFGATATLLSRPAAYAALAVSQLAGWLVLRPLVGEEDARRERRLARRRAAAPPGPGGVARRPGAPIVQTSPPSPAHPVRETQRTQMNAVDTSEVQSGLEGVVAFATEIAEPDKEGGALRYRGVDIEDLVGKVPFEQVWGLLVDGTLEPGLSPAQPYPLKVRSGDPRVDVQSALAMLAPEWGLRPLIDIPDAQAREDLARASVMALSFVAQSARGPDRLPVPQEDVDKGSSIPERFLIRWRGEADPAHVKAIDAYWISAAEHGMNASTFTARIAASTGADCAAALSAAVGALSGPLHGGAPSRVLHMLDEVENLGDADRWVKATLARGERLMGFGHRVYRAEDPRARVLRRTAKELGSRRFDVAESLEKAALAELKARKPDRVLATNVEFWSAVILDLADVPAQLFTPMFTCARTAGWSAHILEQKREGRLIRPTAKYIGPGPRTLGEV